MPYKRLKKLSKQFTQQKEGNETLKQELEERSKMFINLKTEIEEGKRRIKVMNTELALKSSSCLELESSSKFKGAT